MSNFICTNTSDSDSAIDEVLLQKDLVNGIFYAVYQRIFKILITSVDDCITQFQRHLLEAFKSRLESRFE